jgi:hypothetical protein
MKNVLKFPVEKVIPSIESVLKAQGISDISGADERIFRLAEEALSAYEKLAEPVAMITDISKTDFKDVFYGEGNNEKDAPLGPIYRSSEYLALFAVTLGNRICTEISDRIEANDFAEASMLDSAASEGAEKTADVLELSCRESLPAKERDNTSKGVMRFSPGYCGWHISGQKKLFEFLRPGEIGIELNDSYLMTPLKSVSGVVVAGKKEIFIFDDVFDFCADCDNHSCRDRIKALMESDSS